MITIVLPLSASFIIMSLFLQMLSKASLCPYARLLNGLDFSCRSRFPSFTKNMFSSLALFLFGNKLVSFFTNDLSVMFSLLNVSFSLNLHSNSLRFFFFLVVILLFRAGQNFNRLISSFVSVYVDWFRWHKTQNNKPVLFRLGLLKQWLFHSTYLMFFLLVRVSLGKIGVLVSRWLYMFLL